MNLKIEIIFQIKMVGDELMALLQELKKIIEIFFELQKLRQEELIRQRMLRF